MRCILGQRGPETKVTWGTCVTVNLELSTHRMWRRLCLPSSGASAGSSVGEGRPGCSSDVREAWETGNPEASCVHLFRPLPQGQGESEPLGEHPQCIWACGPPGLGGFPGSPRATGRRPPGAWEAAGISSPCN